jgi:hypothetical protein
LFHGLGRSQAEKWQSKRNKKKFVTQSVPRSAAALRAIDNFRVVGNSKVMAKSRWVPVNGAGVTGCSHKYADPTRTQARTIKLNGNTTERIEADILNRYYGI